MAQLFRATKNWSKLFGDRKKLVTAIRTANKLGTGILNVKNLDHGYLKPE